MAAKGIYFAPVFLIRLAIAILRNKKTGNKNEWRTRDRAEFYIWSNVRLWPWEKAVRLGNVVKPFRVVRPEDLPGSILITSNSGGAFDNFLPVIKNMSAGGKISYDFGDELFYILSDVSFSIESDFVRSGDRVACPKLLREDASVLLPEDIDFVKRNGNEVLLSVKPLTKTFESVFYLSGVLSNFWSHFLIYFYPRLRYLSFVTDKQITIVVPYKTDPHIRELIEKCIEGYTNFSIVEVDHDTEVHCKTLYYAALNSYLLCHSNHVSPYGVQISELTYQFWAEQLKRVTEKKGTATRKLFIGRSGGRNISNYQEVLEYFKQLGFEEVFPHKLSFADKVNLFKEAKYIVGPYSSGFTNLIYCQTGVMVLAFVNYARSFDVYVSTISRLFGQNFMMYTGKDVDEGINSNYEIQLMQLRDYIQTQGMFA